MTQIYADFISVENQIVICFICVNMRANDYF